MARRALQVVGQGPVDLVAQSILDPGRQLRGHAAELGMPERIGATARIGDETAIGRLDALGGHHHAVAHALDHLFHLGQERGLVVGALGQQDDVRGVIGALAGQARGRRKPAGMAAHRFVHEHLGRGLGHRGHVQRRFAHRDGRVLGRRAEARAGIGHGQIVVDGLGHADAGQVVVEGLGQLGDLPGGIGRIVAAVVEEPAHIVRAQHLEQPLVPAAVGLQRFELVAARAERAAGGMGEGGDRGSGFLRGVDQVLAERAENTVACGQDLDSFGPCRADDRRGRGIDDGGDAA